MQPPFTCTNNKQWVITQSSGYIANSVAMDTSCGSPSSPLTIQVQEGQRINLTLYNFDRLTSSSRDFSDADTDCDAYAHVIDKMADRTIPVCRGGAREKHIVISSNRSVDIVLYTTKSDGFPHGPILVYFEAIGCPNFKPPEGMWVKRTEDDAQVGCDVTREVGTLLCIDGKWRGDIYNCSKLSRDEHKHVPKGLSHGVSVVIIVTIAIGIGVVVLLCGIVVIKRMKKPPHREVHLHPTRCNDEAEELEQLKVNYDNELRKTTCHANEPELLQHVLYDKSKKDGGCLPPGGITTGYSPLHTCMHDAAHVQLRAPEVLWKATSLARNAATTCDYDVTGGAGGVKTLNSTSGGGPGGSTAAPSGSHPHKDNVAMVQPCTMTTFSTNPDKGDGEAVVTTTCTLPSNSTTGPPSNNEGGPPSNNTLNPPGGRQSLRSFHDSVYSDRPACVHAQAVRGDSQRQPARNPRNIYEPKRTRVLYTLNNSF